MVKNLEQAKKLVLDYRNITLQDIIECSEGLNEFDAYDVLNYLTGFGQGNTCVLCKAADEERSDDALYGCKNNCIYQHIRPRKEEWPPCVDELYLDMENASSPEELLELIKKRANYIDDLINEVEEYGYSRALLSDNSDL